MAGDALWAAVDGGVERFEQPGPDAQPAGTVDLGSPGYGNDLIEWDGALYVTRLAGRALAAVDLATGTVRGAPIPIDGSPIAGVVSGDTLWLAVHGSSTGDPGSVRRREGRSRRRRDPARRDARTGSRPWTAACGSRSTTPAASA